MLYQLCTLDNGLVLEKILLAMKEWLMKMLLCITVQLQNDKASGKQKLKDLGLDDDEIKALTGA
jgi:hypothetical protein